ncbi:MAG: hypothetical protein JO045_07520 [Mycobacterium sp.]|nr:hypothetical protein [Mycobacterium sp.]
MARRILMDPQPGELALAFDRGTIEWIGVAPDSGGVTVTLHHMPDVDAAPEVIGMSRAKTLELVRILLAALAQPASGIDAAIDRMLD